MTEKLEQIFKELSDLEAAAAKLWASAGSAQSRTDLEVAILIRQLADQRAKNRRAQELIDKSIDMLKGEK